MIRTENLDVVFDNFELHGINLDIKQNEFFVLMGPTGAGKTVLIESIAGITPVKSGRIELSGRDITRLPPEKRGVGIVYQDYALFPHMSVKENILYAVKYHSLEKAPAKERLEKLCGDLDIKHLLDRYPSTLSGGEQQRTALARAMMFEPEVLMLDEPLSALDPGFRLEIQELLRRLRDTTEITFLMVTHDFSEALSLADRAAVMNNGRIEQIDEVQNLFRKPATEFVAGFVGMKNIIHADISGNLATAGELKIELAETAECQKGILAVRPEDIVLYGKPPENVQTNSFKGRIAASVDRGFFFEVVINFSNHDFTALLTKGAAGELDLKAGEHVFFSFKPEAIHCF